MLLGNQRPQFLDLGNISYPAAEARIEMVEGYAKRWLGEMDNGWSSINEWLSVQGFDGRDKGIRMEIKGAVRRLGRNK